MNYELFDAKVMLFDEISAKFYFIVLRLRIVNLYLAHCQKISLSLQGKFAEIKKYQNVNRGLGRFWAVFERTYTDLSIYLVYT